MKKKVKAGMFVMALLCFGCLAHPKETMAWELATETPEGVGDWQKSDNEYDLWQEDEENYEDNLWETEENVSTGYYQYEDKALFVGDMGAFPVPETVQNNLGAEVAVGTAVFTQEDDWMESEILTLDRQGNYEAVGIGTVTVNAEFYDAAGTWLLTTVYRITIKIDMSLVTLDKKSETKYMLKGSYSEPQFIFTMQPGERPLPEDEDVYQISCESSNPEMNVSCSIGEGHTIVLYPDSAGKTNVTITVNEKTFHVTIKVVEVYMKQYSLLMRTKQGKQLRVAGIKDGIKWSSTNAKVVKVTSKGMVRTKKNGNAVIKAKVGDITMGCAVSVVSPKRQKTIRHAIKIGQTCTYSQPKRMEKNYYDCSSLVWRSYKLSGITFGNANYAPVSADQGKWCVKNKKIVKGGLSDKNIQNMKLHAGDLMFETSDNNNGRFRGIYHVEMISGYVCYGFDTNGKPILGVTWANRPVDYYWHGGQMVGRP